MHVGLVSTISWQPRITSALTSEVAFLLSDAVDNLL